MGSEMCIRDRCIPTVVEGLSAEDPAGKEYYAKRGDQVVKSYKSVHLWAMKRIKELPMSQQVLVTSHDAFNYFGKAFGFQVIAIQGLSTVNEAGLADIVNTVAFLKSNQLKAIFVETSVNQAAIERVAQDAGVNIGGELFSDSCGKPGELQGRTEKNMMSAHL